ncbi:hypothetical protein JCM19233_3243 [Vibrio astriarenae]|nr:hypothetical protein JCM19233_3243 [Vibrio sp. C7]
MRYLVAFVITLMTLTGCSSTYYAAMEQVGYHKRDIMVDRVEDAKESQQEAQQEFTSALEALSALTNFNGGELESVYKDINRRYEASEAAAQDVRDRIEAIEDVSDALFDEWQQELALYSNDKLRRSSEQKLRDTKASYQTMLAAMWKAEQKMTPVLDTLRDNTLYLKHNLNASAIGSLQGEFMS